VPHERDHDTVCSARCGLRCQLVSVDELFWYDNTRLVAATHGRGMFMATLGGSTPPPPLCSLAASPTSFTSGTATNITLSATCSNSPTSYAWTSSAGAPAVPTPTVGNVVTAAFPSAAAAGTYTYSVMATNAGGTSPAASASVTVNAAFPPGASVKNDFNGDGKSDILWYNAATGMTSAWLMTGTSIMSTAVLLTRPDWEVTGY
jgi:hypothetical protein